MRPQSALALRAAGLLLLLSGAAACSQIILGGEGMAYTNESMSARTFDFRSPASLSFEVVAVPPNFQLTGVPGTPQQKDFPIKTKWGIVCQAANTMDVRAALVKYVGVKSLGNKYGGLCYDGLNEAGLSGGYLWDTSNQGYTDITPPFMLATPDAPAAPESISYFDYPLRILAACDTIGCAKDLTAKLVIVNRPMLVNVSQALVCMDFIPMHATFCDKTAKCIAVEWGPGGVAMVADLPNGVLTNAPPLPVQEALLAAYDAASLSIYTSAFTALNWPGGVASTNLTFVNSSQVDSNTRYIRAVRLRRLFGPVPFIDADGDLSPAMYGTGYSAFAQMNAMIDHLKIGGAYPSGYTAYWQGEMTVVTSVRDHMRGDYYLRVATNMNSHKFNVKSNTRGGKIRVRTISSIIKQKDYAISVKV